MATYVDKIKNKVTNLRIVTDILMQGATLAEYYQSINGALPAVVIDDELDAIQDRIPELIAYVMDAYKTIVDSVDADYPVPPGGFS